MPANSYIHYNIVFNFQQLEEEYDTGNKKTAYRTCFDSGWDAVAVRRMTASNKAVRKCLLAL